MGTRKIISNKTRQHSGDIEELADILKTMADEVTGDITGVAIESGGGYVFPRGAWELEIGTRKIEKLRYLVKVLKA